MGLLRISEAAQRLCVSDATVLRLLDRGHLRRIKVLDATRICEDDLKDYINRGGKAA